MNRYKDRAIVRLVEEIEFKVDGHAKKVLAKVDTGATMSSVDINLASELKLGPILKSKLVKSAHGSKLRPVVEADIMLKGKELRSKFTLADRSHLKYPVLIGVNVLREGYLVDPHDKDEEGGDS